MIGTGHLVVHIEVGAATGIDTLPLAQRGMMIVALELGADLAGVARDRLGGLPNVEVIDADFETWEPPTGRRFDMIVAATSWHWIDPTVTYP